MPICKSMQNSWIDHKCSAISEYNWTLLTQHSAKIDYFFSSLFSAIQLKHRLLHNEYWDGIFVILFANDKNLCSFVLSYGFEMTSFKMSVIFLFCLLLSAQVSGSISLHKFVSIFFSIIIGFVRIMRLFETFKSTSAFDFHSMNLRQPFHSPFWQFKTYVSDQILSSSVVNVH